MNKRLRADFALAVSALIWGITFVVVKNALANASIFVFIAVRFALAAILMAAMFRKSLRALNFQTVRVGAQIGIFMFGGFAFQTAGLKFTTPSKAAFITGFCVVLVPVFQAIFGARRITAWIWAGALAALAGLYLLTVPPEGFASLNRGDLLVLACAVLFALHIIFIGRYARNYPATVLSFLQIATTAVLATLAVPLFSAAGWEVPRFVPTGSLIAAVSVTAIGATVICFSLQTWAQRYTSPSHTAILVSLEPVFAAITSWFVAHERLGARAFAGAALILAGILLAELFGPAPAIPESPEPIRG